MCYLEVKEVIFFVKVKGKGKSWLESNSLEG